MTKVLDEIAVAHPTRNSLPSAARTQVASLLNLRLADAIVSDAAGHQLVRLTTLLYRP